ncbi:MAG: DUF4162 domain-containing protein, partial [Segetibacter sp.]
VQGIKQQFKENLFRIQLANKPAEITSESFSVVKEASNQLTVKICDGSSSNDVLKYFINENATVEAFSEILPSLNEVFIRLVEGTKTSRQFQNVAV